MLGYKMKFNTARKLLFAMCSAATIMTIEIASGTKSGRAKHRWAEQLNNPLWTFKEEPGLRRPPGLSRAVDQLPTSSAQPVGNPPLRQQDLRLPSVLSRGVHQLAMRTLGQPVGNQPWGQQDSRPLPCLLGAVDQSAQQALIYFTYTEYGFSPLPHLPYIYIRLPNGRFAQVLMSDDNRKVRLVQLAPYGPIPPHSNQFGVLGEVLGPIYSV